MNPQPRRSGREEGERGRPRFLLAAPDVFRGNKERTHQLMESSLSLSLFLIHSLSFSLSLSLQLSGDEKEIPVE